MLTEETYQSEIARITTAFECLGVDEKALKPIKTQKGTPDERLLFRLIAIADVLENYAKNHNSQKRLRTKRTTRAKGDGVATESD